MKDEQKTMEWEAIPGVVKGKLGLLNPSTMTLFRTRVPGGWILCIDTFGATFYPDPGHKWDGNSLPSDSVSW